MSIFEHAIFSTFQLFTNGASLCELIVTDFVIYFIPQFFGIAKECSRVCMHYLNVQKNLNLSADNYYVYLK